MKKRKLLSVMLTFAFSCIIVYLLVFYFYLDYDLPKEALYLPVFFRGMGYVIVAICFLTSNLVRG